MASTEPSAGELTTKTILIVDDEAAILDLLKSVLLSRMPGVKVLTAISAEVAIEILSRETVDVIVTDQRMPGKSGLEFLREIHGVQPRAPRMMLTAFPEETLAIAALNDGRVKRFLTKPVQTKVFLEVVGELVAESRAKDSTGLALARSLSALHAKRE